MLHKSYFLTSFNGCNVSDWLNGATVYVINRHENFRNFPLNFRSYPQKTPNDFWLKIDPQPLLSHLVTACPPYQTTSQNYYPLPKPKVNALPLESSCYCLTPKYLPVRTNLLLQNVIQANARNLGLMQTVTRGRPLSIHQQPVNCLTAVPEV